VLKTRRQHEFAIHSFHEFAQCSHIKFSSALHLGYFGLAHTQQFGHCLLRQSLSFTKLSKMQLFRKSARACLDSIPRLGLETRLDLAPLVTFHVVSSSLAFLARLSLSNSRKCSS